MKSRYLQFLVLPILGMFSTGAFAGWTLVNALDHESDLEKVVTINFYPAGVEETPGSSAIIQDPLGFLRNPDGTVAMVYRGTVGADPRTRYVQRFLFPEPTPTDQKWTWYHRFMLPANAVNSWQELGPLTDWGLGEDENPLVRGLGIWWHNWPPSRDWAMNQAGQWVTPPYQFEFDTWYEYFAVVDPVSATVNLYVRGGEFVDLVLLHENGLWANLDLVDPFRSLQQIFVGGEAGSAPQYYNSMYIDYTGANLMTPEGLSPVYSDSGVQQWAGFGVDSHGFVDTGSWLGTLHVESAPWIYSIKVNSWLFIEEDLVNEEGGWLFLFSD